MNPVTLFLCGDVMTGRGIDQILAHPSEPHLYEQYMHSALDYVRLAEHRTGPIARPVGSDYVWGDALEVMRRVRPAARIVNLETAVTRAETPWPGKGIHYRMHPDNVGCLLAAGIDCCVLANNHVLDWGYDGLFETCDVLHRAGLRTAGAGADAPSARAPATLPLPGGGRALVFAFGMENAGVPAAWTAQHDRPGVNLLPDLSDTSLRHIATRVEAIKQPRDIAVASLHWGPNWGFGISAAQRAFAHRLIDDAAIDVVHGHSSHHPIGIEVHGEKLILYGCGDFLNDYEGIDFDAPYRRAEEMRTDVVSMYFPVLDGTTGRLIDMRIQPLRIRGFRLAHAAASEARRLQAALERASPPPGIAFENQSDGSLLLRWR